MSKAHDALTLATTIHATLEYKLKQYLRLVAHDDVILSFKDGSYLVYCYNKNSYRQDKLIIEHCQDNLPFCPLDQLLPDKLSMT